MIRRRQEQPPKDVTNWYVCDETRGGCGKPCEANFRHRNTTAIRSPLSQEAISLCCNAPVRVATGRKEKT